MIINSFSLESIEFRAHISVRRSLIRKVKYEKGSSILWSKIRLLPICCVLIMKGNQYGNDSNYWDTLESRLFEQFLADPDRSSDSSRHYVHQIRSLTFHLA